MKIAITGGCGFVGRHFAKHFADQKHDVLIVDNLVSGIKPFDWAFKPDNWHYVTPLFQDCREFFRYNSASEFDLILHCAAIVGGRLKIEGDPLAVATDLSIDAEFFNWCVREKPLPRKAVYFSSSAVYPIQFQTRTDSWLLGEWLVSFNDDELGLGRPDMTYGWAKLTGEYLAKFAVEKYGLDVAVYRPFSGYGEDQSFDYPFPSIVKRVLDGENPVTIWGSGEQQRDFIHIDDVVGAVCSSMDALKPGDVLNLGNGRPVSFIDLAHSTADVLHHKIFTQNDPDKPEGVFSRVCDPAKMLACYKPKVSLVEGIRRTVDFMKKRVDSGELTV